MLINDEQIMFEHIKIINLLKDQELSNLLQLLSLYATTPEGHAPRACAPQEKPTQLEACTLQLKIATHSNWRKPTYSREDPEELKTNK